MIVFLSFVGFESVVILGCEFFYFFKDIFKVLCIVILLLGVLFLVWVYVLGLGFKVVFSNIFNLVSLFVSFGDFL